MASSFGAINLEDITAPVCFEIERRLIDELDIPVFHDDQHGTPIVVGAALINAFKLLKNKKIRDEKIVMNGAGASGIAIAKHLSIMCAQNIILVDLKGIIHSDYPGIGSEQKRVLKITNPKNIPGSLQDALKEVDVFIGVSAPNVLTVNGIKLMKKDPIVFAMANPVPEIMPELVKEAGVATMGTGRSDFPNQINNVLAFPGIFKGALEAKATEINEDMRLAASYAVGNLIKTDKLDVEYLIPDLFDRRIVPDVAEAVKKEVIKSNLIRKTGKN